MRFFFLWILFFSTWADSSSEEKKYLEVRKKLSSQHCSDKTYRGVYVEQEKAQKNEQLVLDFSCPKKMFFNWSIGSKLLFFYSGNEAWLVYNPEKNLIGKRSEVEYFSNPHSRWLGPWLSLFKKYEIANSELRQEAQLFLAGYDLESRFSEEQTELILKPKKKSLPTIQLNYKNQEPLPETVKILIYARSFQLKRVQWQEFQVESNRHFDPYVPQGAKVKRFD